MTIAFAFVGIFGALLKLTAAKSSTFFSVWIVYVAACLIHFCVISRKGFSCFKTEHIITHFFRGLAGVIATVFYAIALQHISLMNATLLFNTTPLFVPLLAMIFLRQKVALKVWIALIVGFVGIVFIIKPNSQIFNKPWDLIGLASGICLAGAFLLVKILTRTDPIERVVFYFFFFSALIMTLALPFYWMPLTLEIIGLAFAAATAFVLGQIFLVYAYHVADPASVGSFQYTSVLVAGIIDWIFWNITPTLTTYIGTILVILGGVLAILLSKRKANRL